MLENSFIFAMNSASGCWGSARVDHARARGRARLTPFGPKLVSTSNHFRSSDEYREILFCFLPSFSLSLFFLFCFLFFFCFVYVHMCVYIYVYIYIYVFFFNPVFKRCYDCGLDFDARSFNAARNSLSRLPGNVPADKAIRGARAEN